MAREQSDATVDLDELLDELPYIEARPPDPPE
jgi:hypothetical protein